jgi:hypothetical protein
MVRKLGETGTSASDVFANVGKIYPDASGNKAQEWYFDKYIEGYDFEKWEGKRLRNIMKRTNLRWREDEDPNCWSVTGAADMRKEDGKVRWHEGKGDVRLEGWSESADKPWLNLEITVYAKYVGKLKGECKGDDGWGPFSDKGYAFQLYGRGGHHGGQGKETCEGGCYKIALMQDGEVRVRKEVNHGCYLNDKGGKEATGNVKGRWIGLKQVLYNYRNDEGKTCAVNEIWIDDESDVNGKLRISNKWRNVSNVIDTGEWGDGCSDEKFEGGCDTLDIDEKKGTRRIRKHVISMPGGTSKGNLGSLRSDSVKLLFKNFSIREIEPPKNPPEGTTVA